MCLYSMEIPIPSTSKQDCHIFSNRGCKRRMNKPIFCHIDSELKEVALSRNSSFISGFRQIICCPGHFRRRMEFLLSLYETPPFTTTYTMSNIRPAKQDRNIYIKFSRFRGDYSNDGLHLGLYTV